MPKPNGNGQNTITITTEEVLSVDVLKKRIEKMKRMEESHKKSGERIKKQIADLEKLLPEEE